MKQTLLNGNDKVQQICDALRKDTLEPAKLEAEKIIAQAKVQAEAIIKEAQTRGQKIVEEANHGIEREKNIFHASLEQAVKLCIEDLKQRIENKLFKEELKNISIDAFADSKIVSNLIEAVVQAIQKDGISTDFSALVSNQLSAADIKQLLSEATLKKLRNHSVELGGFNGGVKIKLHDRQIMLDISANALEELLGKYLRKDFHKFLFRS